MQGSGVYGLQAARVMMPASWVLAGVLACDQHGGGPGANNTGGEGRAQVGVEGFQDLGVGKAAAIFGGCGGIRRDCEGVGGFEVHRFGDVRDDAAGR